MKIAFTICSNNYLGQVKALINSFLKYNQDYIFYIGLVDRKSTSIDYNFFNPAFVIPIEEIGIPNFAEIVEKFNIIELNTSVKPSFAKYLLKRHTAAEILYYLDPDLYFYDSLKSLDTRLIENNFAITPHILSPIQLDDRIPGENLFLNYGLYNLGFLGLNTKSQETIKMLDWWEERTLNLGYDRIVDGLFVDQLWINFLPIYFDKVLLLKELGYNMAPWNLHERNIKSFAADGKVLLNDDSNLVFYHFSNMNNEDSSRPSRFYNRYSFDQFVLLKDLYNSYIEELNKCNLKEFKAVPFAFGKPDHVEKNGFQSLKARLKAMVRQ